MAPEPTCHKCAGFLPPATEDPCVCPPATSGYLQTDAPPCPTCGSIMVPSGPPFRCLNCAPPAAKETPVSTNPSIVGQPWDVPAKEGRWTFTADMREISGFGGGYEQTCRNMLAAGLDWWEANPQADPQFKGYRYVYGFVYEENDDAKALSAAVVAPAGGDASGAMHQAVISHIFFIRKNGWERYCEEMRKVDAK